MIERSSISISGSIIWREAYSITQTMFGLHVCGLVMQLTIMTILSVGCIYTECYRFLELGHITRDGLRNLTYLYKTYHTMGGNGTGTNLYERASALPIRDD